jgi:hypothetical protein
LGYVVHADAAVKPSAQDLPTAYTTIQEEMIAGMPHTHIAFREDNIKVCATPCMKQMPTTGSSAQSVDVMEGEHIWL